MLWCLRRETSHTDFTAPGPHPLCTDVKSTCTPRGTRLQGNNGQNTKLFRDIAISAFHETKQALSPAPPPCDIPSGRYFCTGPWTVTRSSLRMLRRVAAFCRPLRPVSLPYSQSPVVGVSRLCWLRRMPFVRWRSPVVGVPGGRWLLRGSFGGFCWPRTPPVHVPAIFWCSFASSLLNLLHFSVVYVSEKNTASVALRQAPATAATGAPPGPSPTAPPGAGGGSAGASPLAAPERTGVRELSVPHNRTAPACLDPFPTPKRAADFWGRPSAQGGVCAQHAHSAHSACTAHALQGEIGYFSYNRQYSCLHRPCYTLNTWQARQSWSWAQTWTPRMQMKA